MSSRTDDPNPGGSRTVERAHWSEPVGPHRVRFRLCPDCGKQPIGIHICSQETPRAADLPDGTVVANALAAYIKNYPLQTHQWRGTNGTYLTNDEVSRKLATTARVLRYGYGEDDDA